MVLHHVADRAHFLVEGAAALNAEIFGHGDLNVADVFAIPYRLEKRVGKPEVQNVLHGFLAQVVIDAKNGGLAEHIMQGAVKRLCAGEIPAEGFLDDDPGVRFGAAALLQPLNHAGKHAGRNRQIINWTLRQSQRLLQLGEGLRIRVVAVNIAQQSGQFCETLLVVVAALLHAVARALGELLQAPSAARHPDYWDMKSAPAHHGVERGKNFLVRQIAGGAKEHKGIGFNFVHNFVH